ncbi:MAG: SOS mutagenesis and repair protein UmuC [Crocinitomicaceae bacterium]|nr:SOS mutagenesis and repair protein UmuC [Crocinitomicaceae bacterium]
MIALVDCNNFYASCERVFQPHLDKKPIVVLSNNDGCVIARSNESKLLGVKMGAPAFKMKEIFEKNNVQVFSSNFALYGDLSKRVMTILEEESPEIEVYSIDEAFLGFKGFKDVNKQAAKIRHKVKKWTGIPVSIGIGPTKTLAKVANHVAKKHTKTGVFVLNDFKFTLKVLKRIPIGEVWGIGRRYASFLCSNGVITAYDLTQKSECWVKRNLKINGLRTLKELKGISCYDLETSVMRKKNICTSRSFGRKVRDFDELKEAVASYATSCAMKLRKEKSLAFKVIVFLTTNPFNTSESQYRASQKIMLDVPTNDGVMITKSAISALQRIYKSGFTYKKAGVIVSEIVPDYSRQLSLFENKNIYKHKNLMDVMDKLNTRMGRDKVRLAVQGFDRKWRLKQERLSPCYTTRFSDMLTVEI